MDKFTKEELDKINLLLKSDNIANYNIAFNLLRINWKLSEVKRYVVKWFLINIIKEEKYYIRREYNWERGIWKSERIQSYNDRVGIRKVMLGDDWRVSWYAKPIIKELNLFEVSGIKHFLLNGKYKDM